MEYVSRYIFKDIRFKTVKQKQKVYFEECTVRTARMARMARTARTAKTAKMAWKLSY